MRDRDQLSSNPSRKKPHLKKHCVSEANAEHGRLAFVITQRHPARIASMCALTLLVLTVCNQTIFQHQKKNPREEELVVLQEVLGNAVKSWRAGTDYILSLVRIAVWYVGDNNRFGKSRVRGLFLLRTIGTRSGARVTSPATRRPMRTARPLLSTRIARAMASRAPWPPAVCERFKVRSCHLVVLHTSDCLRIYLLIEIAARMRVQFTHYIVVHDNQELLATSSSYQLIPWLHKVRDLHRRWACLRRCNSLVRKGHHIALGMYRLQLG
eukprot:3257446-Amphidinium_carterae.2